MSDTLKASSNGIRYTVFAPTNAAFNKMPSGALSQILQPQNKAQLVAILQDHVVFGSEYTRDLMRPAQKTLRTLKNGYVILW